MNGITIASYTHKSDHPECGAQVEHYEVGIATLLLRPCRGQTDAHKRNNRRDKQVYARIDESRNKHWNIIILGMLIAFCYAFTRMIHGYRQSTYIYICKCTQIRT